MTLYMYILQEKNTSFGKLRIGAWPRLNRLVEPLCIGIFVVHCLVVVQFMSYVRSED